MSFFVSIFEEDTRVFMIEKDVHRSQIPAQLEGQIDRNRKLSMVTHALQLTF